MEEFKNIDSENVLIYFLLVLALVLGVVTIFECLVEVILSLQNLLITTTPN